MNILRSAVTVAAFTAALTACSTKPISYTPQATNTAPEAYNVVVKRDKGLMGSSCKVEVFLDGEPKGLIKPSEVIKLNVPVDGKEHILSSRINTAICINALSEQVLTLEAGKVKYYRVSMTGTGTFTLNPTTNLILK